MLSQSCSVCGNTFEFTTRNTPCGVCGATVVDTSIVQVLARLVSKPGALLKDILPALQPLTILYAGVRGPLHEILKQLPHYVPVEFSEEVKGAVLHNGVRFENPYAIGIREHAFDIVITADILHTFTEPLKFLAEIRRVSKSNAVHLFTLPFEIEYYGAPAAFKNNFLFELQKMGFATQRVNSGNVKIFVSENIKLAFTGERFLPEQKGDIAYEHIHRYKIANELVEGKTVLDIASGEGYGSAFLAEKAAHVIGVDISEESVAYAKRRYAYARNVEYRIGSCEDIPCEDNSIDVLVSFETIEHITDHDLFMREIKRVLRPDGIVILSSPNKLTYTDEPDHHNPYHLHELYREDLEILLKKHFAHTILLGQRNTVSSHVWNMACPAIPSMFKHYKENPDNAPHIAQAPFEPVYFLAICSAKAIDFPETASLFTYSSDDLFKEFLKLRQTERDLSEQLVKAGSAIQMLQKEIQALKTSQKDFPQQAISDIPVLPQRIVQTNAEKRILTDKDLFKVSVIIPVFNQLHFTQQCLETLYRNTPQDRNFEVIVVDNASSDGTHEFFQRAVTLYPHLRYIRNNENEFFAKACNRGAREAKGEALVFLNNDTEVEPGWLDAPLKDLEDQEIGIVGIKLLYPDRTIQHAGVEFFKNFGSGHYIWPDHRFRHAPENDPRVNRREDVEVVTGACIFLKREFFFEIGAFADDYGMYFEDTDLCFKVRKAGKRVLYEPASVVIHHEAKSSPTSEVAHKKNVIASKIFYTRWKAEIAEIALRPFIDKKEGTFIFLNEDIWPKALSNGIFSEETILGFDLLLKALPPFYFHFGGIGDALMLMSSFYDRHPESVILSMSNSPAAAKAFFSAFPKLNKVYVLPPVANYTVGMILRTLVSRMKNCLSMGITPPHKYEEVWTPQINIFKHPYNIIKSPSWTQTFIKEKLQPLQVVLAPKGSVYGTFRSKRNTLNPKYWQPLLEFLKANGIRPVVIGTPDEAAAYPLDENCIGRRSYSFKEQMEIIASGDIFIGADSWSKTFAAMCGLPTIVFKPMYGYDLARWVDNSDFVFIHPWENIAHVGDMEEFLKAFDQACRFKNGGVPTVIPQSIAYVKSIEQQKLSPNPQQMTSFDPVFWQRNYDAFKNILLRITPAVGDALILSSVVRSLKAQFPQKEIYISGDERAEWIFKNNPYVTGILKQNSNEELGIEADAEVIEYNHLIDRLPEYFNGLHYNDILANIAGVELDTYELDYTIENDEKTRAAEIVKSFKHSGTLTVGVQLTTNKDVQRSYILPEFLPQICKEFPHANFILFGQETPGLKSDNFLDCATAKVPFRDQIAIAEHCDVFITIDSAFYHVAHNLFKKPTLLIVGPTNEALIGNPALGLTFPVRNMRNGCFPCYWQSDCRKDCLKNLSVRDVISAFRTMLVKVQKGEFPLWSPHLETIELNITKGEDYQQKIAQELFRKGKKIILKNTEYLPPYAINWNGLDINGRRKIQQNTRKEIPQITKIQEEPMDASLPQQNMERIACPYCQSQHAEPYRMSADIVRCLNCLTVYLRTRLTTKAMEKLYQEYANGESHMLLPQTMEEVKTTSLRREYFIQEILDFTDPRGKLLDVGCGWGAFLDSARDKGFQPLGIELTPKCVDFANMQLGIPVSNRQLLDVPFMENSIAVVTMNHVLDHLPEPKEALDKIFAILEPGGMLCGIVPNIESLASQVQKDNWYWLDSNFHYVHYSPATLRSALEKAGFIIERLYTTSGDFGTEKQIELLKRSTDPSISANPEAALKDFEQGGMGEEIRFFARKPVAREHSFKSGQPEQHQVQNVFRMNENPNTIAESSLFKDETATAPSYKNEPFTAEAVKENSFKNEQRLPQINLVWEGSQFVNHTLALINREHTANVIQTGVAEVTIVPYEPDQFSPEGDKKLELLKERDVRFKKPVPEAISKLPYAWVRHQWPPKSEPPRGAKWFVMQPWEFSSVPRDIIESFKNVDEVWTPSNFSRNAFVNSGLDFDKVQIVPNGINPAIFTPSGETTDFPVDKRLKFLFVGGTIFRKGIDVLLQAFVTAFTAADDVCLIIKDMGGDSFYKGQTAKEQIEQIKRNPNAPDIRYTDAIMPETQLAELYRACDVFVSPYRGEGFSLPTLEAMACGLPVIVTDGGATDDFVDEIVGWKIPATPRSVGSVINNREMTSEAFVLEPDANYLADLLKELYQNPQNIFVKGIEASLRARSEWTWNRATLKMLSRLDYHYKTTMARDAEGILKDRADGNILIGHAENLYLAGDVDRAIDTYTEAFKAGGLTKKYILHALHRMASIALADNNIELASNFIFKADEIQPGHVDTIYLHTLCLGFQEDWIEAQEQLSDILTNWKYVRFDTTLGLTLDMLLCDTARALLSTDAVDEAHEIYSEALKMNPENADACYGLAQCFKAMGEHAEARQMLEWAVKLRPDYTIAAEELDIVRD
ncbi:MAG TPA: methyltransferase domain-containing protein [Patescibacteria group bacterium]|nr:methyltransferase domain-containing protein [Patescibacteria group bacterium]